MVPPPQERSPRWDDPLEVPGTERLLTLSDGVVAIALTLLVLQLQIPSLPAGTSPDSSSALWHELTDPSFTSLIVAYLVSFYVIAQFWLAHHRTYRLVSGHSESLAWWNFAFLLTITLFPFSSELLGRYPDNRVAVIEFGANLLLASLATTLTLNIARHQHMLIERATPFVTFGSQIRGIISAAVIVLSMVVAYFSPVNAKYVWLLLALSPAASRLLVRRHLDRHGDPGGPVGDATDAADISGDGSPPDHGTGDDGVGMRSED